MTADTADRQRPSASDGPSVTRVEILDHVGSLFAGGSGVDREALIAEAEQHEARPALLAVLRRLPARRFHRPQDLWPDLPEVPIEP
jgi:hypothetical protein